MQQSSALPLNIYDTLAQSNSAQRQPEGRSAEQQGSKTDEIARGFEFGVLSDPDFPINRLGEAPRRTRLGSWTSTELSEADTEGPPPASSSPWISSTNLPVHSQQLGPPSQASSSEPSSAQQSPRITPMLMASPIWGSLGLPMIPTLGSASSFELNTSDPPDLAAPALGNAHSAPSRSSGRSLMRREDALARSTNQSVTLLQSSPLLHSAAAPTNSADSGKPSASVVRKVDITVQTQCRPDFRGQRHPSLRGEPPSQLQQQQYQQAPPQQLQRYQQQPHLHEHNRHSGGRSPPDGGASETSERGSAGQTIPQSGDGQSDNDESNGGSGSGTRPPVSYAQVVSTPPSSPPRNVRSPSQHEQLQQGSPANNHNNSPSWASRLAWSPPHGGGYGQASPPGRGYPSGAHPHHHYHSPRGPPMRPRGYPGSPGSRGSGAQYGSPRGGPARAGPPRAASPTGPFPTGSTPHAGNPGHLYHAHPHARPPHSPHTGGRPPPGYPAAVGAAPLNGGSPQYYRPQQRPVHPSQHQQRALYGQQGANPSNYGGPPPHAGGPYRHQYAAAGAPASVAGKGWVPPTGMQPPPRSEYQPNNLSQRGQQPSPRQQLPQQEFQQQQPQSAAPPSLTAPSPLLSSQNSSGSASPQSAAMRVEADPVLRPSHNRAQASGNPGVIGSPPSSPALSATSSDPQAQPPSLAIAAVRATAAADAAGPLRPTASSNAASRSTSPATVGAASASAALAAVALASPAILPQPSPSSPIPSPAAAGKTPTPAVASKHSAGGSRARSPSKASAVDKPKPATPKSGAAKQSPVPNAWASPRRHAPPPSPLFTGSSSPSKIAHPNRKKQAASATRSRSSPAGSPAAAAAAAAAPPRGPMYFDIEFKHGRRSVVVGTAPHVLRLLVGENVKVEADRGEDLGKIRRRWTESAYSAAGCPGSSASGGRGLRGHKRLLRKASPAEVQQLARKSQEEAQALATCRAKAQQRRLPMKLHYAEYQFDRHKLTFFFEADRRIDFRELVRDLFAVYKTRIWLQQVPTAFLSKQKQAGGARRQQGR